MSTVTLSQPHWAMTSAEKPDGIASHALTQALPDFSRALSLFMMSPWMNGDHFSWRCTKVECRRDLLGVDFPTRSPTLTPHQNKPSAEAAKPGRNANEPRRHATREHDLAPIAAEKFRRHRCRHEPRRALRRRPGRDGA